MKTEISCSTEKNKTLKTEDSISERNCVETWCMKLKYEGYSGREKSDLMKYAEAVKVCGASSRHGRCSILT